MAPEQRLRLTASLPYGSHFERNSASCLAMALKILTKTGRLAPFRFDSGVQAGFAIKRATNNFCPQMQKARRFDIVGPG